jgi:hypothetical protein
VLQVLDEMPDREVGRVALSVVAELFPDLK